MINKKYDLVLASASPRRRELLKSCYLNFSVEISDIDENINEESPIKLVQLLAMEKASTILERTKKDAPIVLGSDTIVVLDNKILGKPTNKDDARKMLLSLSGKKHIVVTGVALVSKEKSVQFYDETTVVFDEISPDLLELYLNTGESLDKAGSYGIQGPALSFIKKVEGSYSNVVGLPVDKVLSEIKSFIGCRYDEQGKWREQFN